MDLELSAVNIQSSQNLLDISTTVNETSSVVTNDSVGQTSKKEGNLLSWFTSSSSTNTSSAINNPPSNAPATSSSPHAGSHAFNVNDIEQLEDGSSSPNLKISSKLSYGEKFISKFNKNGNKATSSEAPTNEQLTTSASGVSKEPHQKSSRRTTSLLNLFMSNSQGKHISVNKMHSFTFHLIFALFTLFPLCFVIISFFFSH